MRALALWMLVAAGCVESADDTGPADTALLEDSGDSDDTGLSDDSNPPDDTGDTHPPDDLECVPLVSLDADGRFWIGDDGYAPVGTNFHVALGARVRNAATPDLEREDYDWEVFLAPYGNYFPTNNGVCRNAWVDEDLCCTDAEACREMLIEEHVERLVALGIDSVRLVGVGIDYDDDGQPVAYCDRVRDDYAERDWIEQGRCRVDAGDPAMRARVIEVMVEAVELLGAHGIRTILLPGSHGHTRPGARDDYLAFLGELAAELADNPWLLAYDPMNEPPYAYEALASDPYVQGVCPDDGMCKAFAAKASRDWFDAIVAADPNHLVTVGLGNTTHSLVAWDPRVIKDHFTSWHIYPPAPWAPESGVHASRFLRQQIYHLAQNACGVPCPFVGEHDGERCHLATGPVGAEEPFLWETGMYYPYLEGAVRCPVGHDDGANCQVATWSPGRDTPRIHPQAHFYVTAAPTCPSGTTPQGDRCLVGTGPVGARGEVRSPFNQTTGFYYEHLDGPTPCEPPAVDDGARCRWGDVPIPGSPFVAHQPWYFVDAVSCGPRKAAILGETGFAVFPNGADLDPTWYAQGDSRRWNRYQSCTDGDASQRLDGDEDAQIDFLLGGATAGWEGVYGHGLACGVQGLHWWVFGSVNWGMCREDNFGIYNFGYLSEPEATVADPLALVARPFAERLVDLDFLAAAQVACDAPSDFHQNLAREDLPVTVNGTVVDASGGPIANAMVYAWGAGWTGFHTTYTRSDGTYTLHMPSCPPAVGATDFGRKSVVGGGGTCASDIQLGPITLPLEPAAIPTPPLPEPDLRACREEGGPWRVRPAR